MTLCTNRLLFTKWALASIRGQREHGAIRTIFQKDGSTILEPAIGSADYVYDTVPGLSSCMSETSVAQLMRPSGRKWTCGWRRLVQTPAAAWKLPHGASLRIEQFSGSTASYGSSASQVRRIQKAI